MSAFEITRALEPELLDQEINSVEDQPAQDVETILAAAAADSYADDSKLGYINERAESLDDASDRVEIYKKDGSEQSDTQDIPDLEEDKTSSILEKDVGGDIHASQRLTKLNDVDGELSDHDEDHIGGSPDEVLSVSSPATDDQSDRDNAIVKAEKVVAVEDEEEEERGQEDSEPADCGIRSGDRLPMSRERLEVQRVVETMLPVDHPLDEDEAHAASEMADNLGKIPGVRVIDSRSEPGTSDFDYRCTEHAIRTITGEPITAFQAIMVADWNGGGLNELGFDELGPDQPFQNNDLIAYSFGSQTTSTGDGRSDAIEHFAVMRNDKTGIVESKHGQWAITEHPLELVPLSYGNTVRVYRLIPDIIDEKSDDEHPESYKEGVEASPRRIDFTPLTVDEVAEQFDMSRDSNLGVSKAWFKYCQVDNHIYEYPTEEYVRQFGRYLAGRVSEIESEKGRSVRILEVGAGQGLLTQTLSEELQAQGSNCTFKAVDDGSWRGGRDATSTVAERMGYEEAMDTFVPDIVIGAWVPSGIEENHYLKSVDWTSKMRVPTTSEYILIGIPNGPGRHAAPESWGKQRTGTSRSSSEIDVDTPEYERDGFERIDLDHLKPYQLSFVSYTGNMHRSETVVFRRIPKI